MELAEDENKYYLSQKKGYQGELLNDLWVEKLEEELFVLHNLLFEIKNTQFQIDSLIIAQDRIYLLDVKYHEGDYVYKNDGFYTLSNKEIKNHLHQLRRCETLLRQFIQTLGFNFPIESYLIFNNPEFYLYNAPPELPIVYPTQLTRFYNNLNKRPSKLSEKHKILAKKLLDEEKGESSYSKIPIYKYHQIKKGFSCGSCLSLLTIVENNKVVCTNCGHIEHLESALLRNVKEYMLLFPERKVTTLAIYEWCGGVGSNRSFRRILFNNFTPIGHGRFTHFIE
jgi:Nuclease-related domain